jgi:hypothetical protein
MPDEPISGRGGSLILDCCYGAKELVTKNNAGRNEYHHPSDGTLTSVEIDDGSGNTQTITIKDPKKATIVMHYEVP